MARVQGQAVSARPACRVRSSCSPSQKEGRGPRLRPSLPLRLKSRPAGGNSRLQAQQGGVWLPGSQAPPASKGAHIPGILQTARLSWGLHQPHCSGGSGGTPFAPATLLTPRFPFITSPAIRCQVHAPAFVTSFMTEFNNQGSVLRVEAVDLEEPIGILWGWSSPLAHVAPCRPPSSRASTCALSWAWTRRLRSFGLLLQPLNVRAAPH